MATVVSPWIANRVYRVGEVVTYGDTLYMSLAIQADKVPTDTNYWADFATSINLGEDIVARRTTRITGAEFVVSKTTPVEILPAPASGYMPVPRQIVVELVPGSAVFADGGVLQLIVGDNTAVDLTPAATTYGAATAKMAEQVLSLGVLDVQNSQDAGVFIKLKTVDINTAGGVGEVSIATPGTGYAVGDTGTITSPATGTDAEYIVTSIGALGAVTGLDITLVGNKHIVDTGIATAATSGAGNDDLVVDIDSLAWDGEVKVTLYYAMLPVG